MFYFYSYISYYFFKHKNICLEILCLLYKWTISIQQLINYTFLNLGIQIITLKIVIISTSIILKYTYNIIKIRYKY